MSLVRRAEKSWRDTPAVAVAVTVVAGTADILAGVYRALRFQLEAGRTSGAVPHWNHWQDGRRHRATAAGRRRGRARQAGPITSLELVSGVGVLLILAVALGSFLGGSAAYVRYASQLPDARTIMLNTLPEDSLIYDSGGKTVLLDVHKEGYRHYEQRLKEMGQWLPMATVAIEDAKFYHEPGVDLPSIVRAAWIDYHEHKPAQGASTITQQLVKLRLLGNKPSLDRKAKEALLAVQVEQDFSKDQILEMYLNSAFFGNNAYGSLAAARNYYHVDTSQLTLAQAAMLAGLPQNPTYHNPLASWQHAKGRQHDVLQAMVRQKEISQEQADKAFAEDLSEPDHMFRDANIIQFPGFSQFVVSELQARFGKEAPYTNGYRVVSTIRADMEQKAQELVTGNVRKWESWGSNVHDGAMVAIDPKTGEIMAMVGSADQHAAGGQYNMAVWPPRNPGSSMKMFNYTAAIASGKFTMVTPIQDAPITLHSQGQADYKPLNFDKGYHGTCQLQACFLNSYNVPAVKVELGVGIESVALMARNMGAPPWMPPHDGKGYTSDDPLTAYGPSLTLGGYGETPLQMATGASVLGTQGILRQVHSVKTVANSVGGLVYQANPDEGAKRVLDEKVAFIMEQIMSDDANRQAVFGRGSNLTLAGRHVGSKTGTTEDFRDGWTVGFTPSLATAFWFGNPDYSEMPRGAEASQVAAPVWHDFMQWSLDNSLKIGDEWFGEPPGLVHANVNGKLQWFLPGTNPSQQAPPLPTSPAAAWWVTMPPPPKPSDPAKPPSGGGDQGGNH